MNFFLYLVILIPLIFLGGCVSKSSVHPSSSPIVTSFTFHTPKFKKDPILITFYSTDHLPSSPYKILGKKRVSKYNLVGIKRQEASIRDALREIAAKMGGDAIIHLKQDQTSVSGTIITFNQPKILPSSKDARLLTVS